MDGERLGYLGGDHKDALMTAERFGELLRRPNLLSGQNATELEELIAAYPWCGPLRRLRYQKAVIDDNPEGVAYWRARAEPFLGRGIVAAEAEALARYNPAKAKAHFDFSSDSASDDLREDLSATFVKTAIPEPISAPRTMIGLVEFADPSIELSSTAKQSSPRPELLAEVEAAPTLEVLAEAEVAPAPEVLAEAEVAPTPEVLAEAEVASAPEVLAEAEVAPAPEVLAEAEAFSALNVVTPLSETLAEPANTGFAAFFGDHAAVGGMPRGDVTLTGADALKEPPVADLPEEQVAASPVFSLEYLSDLLAAGGSGVEVAEWYLQRNGLIMEYGRPQPAPIETLRSFRAWKQRRAQTSWQDLLLLGLEGRPSGKTRKPKRSDEPAEPEVASETLADLLASQGHHEKAIRMYEQLSLRHPAKMDTFAARIQALQHTQA